MRHESAISQTDTWLTPPALIRALGNFDLDPCTPPYMPWATAAHRYTILEDGLRQDWFGRVWLNPPYGKVIASWLHKLAEHGNGIALVFARTETEWFRRTIWERGDGILFLHGRVKFLKPDGTTARSNGGAPSCLIAYGEKNLQRLEAVPIPGQFLPVNYRKVVVVGVSPTWFSVVSIAVKQHGDDSLRPVYEMVERLAPDKILKNRHWKAKVRQQVQQWRRRQVEVLQSELFQPCIK